jgi:hypothetical protein
MHNVYYVKSSPWPDPGLSLALAGAMFALMPPDFCDAFQRWKDGSWRCIRAAEWGSPVGRIQVSEGTVFTRGTSFMGLDMAKLLDDDCLEKAA